MKPGITTYNAVIDACAKSGEMEREWLSKAQEIRLKPEIITYSAVINACAKFSKAQEARLHKETKNHAVIETCA